MQKMAAFSQICGNTIVMVFLNALLFGLNTATIHAEVVFEAAFQGECHTNGPCQHLCFDLHDGTFECACNDGYTLANNGYGCIENHLYEGNRMTERNGTKMIKKGFRRQSNNKQLSNYATDNNNLLTNIDESADTNSDNPIYYSCEDIECEAGGTCLLDDIQNDKRIRCRCPLGRGGFFCQKPVEVRFPRFRRTSYLALPTLRDAHKSMQINIEFRPEHHDGVLLYSGEKQTLEGDFIAVVLNQGFAEFRFDCGMGIGVIRSDMPIILNSWNTLSIYRDGSRGWMQLNQGQQMSGQSKGLFSRITFRLELFLGGSPNISQISKRTHVGSGFVGCVRTLEINGRLYDFRFDNRGDTIDGIDIEECSSDACSRTLCLNGGQCVAASPENGLCLCPLGYAGDHCEKDAEFTGFPSFNGSSYLQFPGLSETALSYIEIQMVFKPRSPNGLLLYNGNRMDGNGDFISLNLIDGFVEFRFDLGTGEAVIRNTIPISMDQWHAVVISRTGREGTLQVDDQLHVRGSSLRSFSQLSLALNLFIGGVSDLKDVQRNAYATNLFSGCIQKVIINNRPLMLLEEALSGVNVVDCQHSCNNNPCLQNGRCEPKLDGYTCHCPLKYFGSICEREVNETISVPMFYGNSYFEYMDDEIMKRIRGYKTDIQLRIRAFSPEGVIMWTGMGQMNEFSDFMSLGIRDGFVHFTFNLGSGLAEIVYNKSRIDDGRWHNMHVSRYKREAYIVIDNGVPVKGKSIGTQSQLNTDTGLFIGGLEDAPMQSHRYKSGIIGCVSHLTLSTDYHVHLMTQAIRGINIRACI